MKDLSTASLTGIKAIYSGLYPSLIQYIDIDSLKFTENTHRMKSSLTEFASSLSENGFLRPVVVDNSLAVIDGVKRVAASRALGYSELPCIFSHCPLAFEDDLLTEKLRDGNTDYFTSADIVGKLTRVYLYSQDAVASSIGKSQSYVANKLRLLRFTPEERKIASRAQLTERHCRALLGVKKEDERKAALSFVADSGLNVAETEEYVSSLRAGQRQDPSSFPEDLERFLSERSEFYSVVKLSGGRNRSCYRITLSEKQ